MYRKIDIKKALHTSLKEHAIMFLRALSIYVLAIICGTLAYTKGKYGNVGCIMSLPVASLMGVLFFREKLQKRQCLAIAGALIAVVLITCTNPVQLFVWDAAYLYAFGCVIFFSFGLIAHKWNTSLSNIETTFILMFYGSFQLLAIVLFSGGFQNIILSTFAFFLILGGGICNIVLLLLSNIGIKESSGIMLGLVFSTQPVFAVLFGFVFFSEIPTMFELFGIAIIVFCLYIAGTKKRRACHCRRTVLDPLSK